MSVEAPVGIITQDALAAALAYDRPVLGAFRAEVDAGRFDVLRFGLQQQSAAVFTNNGFHMALCYRVIKSPYPIKAVEIEDGERPPLVYFEVEIRDGLGRVFYLSRSVGHIAFGKFINGDERGRPCAAGGAGRTIFLVVGKASKAIRDSIAEGLEPPGLCEGEGLPEFVVIISFLQDMSGAHDTAQFCNVIWHG